jgi:hypothetical protein
VSRRIHLLFLILAIAPPVLTAVLIARYAVNVPYYDDWDNAVAMHLAHLKGTLTPGMFFEQSNDSRPAIPRAIWLLSSIATNGNRRAEMWISFTAVCVTSLVLLLLARRTIPKHALPLIAIANWFLFSPVQYENWVWANQLMLFLPVTLFAAALLASYSNWPIGWKVAAGIALWIASVLCFVSGLFFWPLMFGVQLFVAPANKRVLVTGAWVVALALTAGMFYATPMVGVAPMRPGVFVQHPKEAIAFFCCYFAGPFRIHGMTWYHLWALGAAITVLALLPLMRLVSNRTLVRDMLPWAAILSFAVISGAAVTSSRSVMGLPQSQVSRYTTTTVLVPIAAIFLWVITKPLWSRQARRLMLVLATGLLAMHLVGSFQRISDLESVSATRLAARSALLRINVDDHDPLLLQLYPDLARLKRLANEYSELGLFPPLEPQPAPR